MNRPTVLLADEPTGALDSTGAVEVLALLRDLHDDGLSIVLVTHDAAVASAADEVVSLHDGCLSTAIAPSDLRERRCNGAMSMIWACAWRHLRANGRAFLVLALMWGAVAGIALAAFGAARRTSTVVDRIMSLNAPQDLDVQLTADIDRDDDCSVGRVASVDVTQLASIEPGRCPCRGLPSSVCLGVAEQRELTVPLAVRGQRP